jgi:alkylation response protein AidB-like acyl-CoA dehydrogenase
VNPATILSNVWELSTQFAQERNERQRRRGLLASDFTQLKEAGFLLTAVPVEQGGIWESVQRSTRPVSDILRTLSHGDSSVALVCSMHPAVLSFWLATPEVPSPFQDAWQEQRRRVFQTACQGYWWGTITSEPGSGGDIAETKATARPGPTGSSHLVTGQKHFGSGSGVTSYMLTTAVQPGGAEPDWFFMDMKDVPWDGSAGVRLLTEWDGHGMTATQSHAMIFHDFPAERIAWPGNYLKLIGAAGGFITCLFAAVIVGIVESAIQLARQQLESRRQSLRSYDQVEWARVETEGWLIQQAYEGMLRAMEMKGGLPLDAIQGKIAIAELAESVTRRICRIIGGGTLSRQSPYGFWFEDVRALGFLRPPWGLAFERLFEESWSTQ